MIEGSQVTRVGRRGRLRHGAAPRVAVHDVRPRGATAGCPAASRPSSSGGRRRRSTRFSSIEEYLAGHTAGYYEVLRAVGGPSWDPSRDARPWIRFCLTAHLRSGIRLGRRIRETEALWSALEELIAKRRLPERTIDAVADAARGGRVRNHAYRTLVGLNEQQAGRDLRALVAAGLLEARGEARGRLYVGSPELLDVHAKVRQDQDPAELADPFGA